MKKTVFNGLRNDSSHKCIKILCMINHPFIPLLNSSFKTIPGIRNRQSLRSIIDIAIDSSDGSPSSNYKVRIPFASISKIGPAKKLLDELQSLEADTKRLSKFEKIK